MTRQQKIMGLMGVMVFTILASGLLGYKMGRGSVRIPEPTIVERIDTVTVIEIKVDTIETVRTVTKYLPVAMPEPEDTNEPMDTIDYGLEPIDSVKVEVPISRYVAQQDSLYRVVAEGYEVEFKEITVYPKTLTITNTVEIKKPSHWGLGIQAGYGATLIDKTIKLSPYIGAGISYNIISW